MMLEDPKLPNEPSKTHHWRQPPAPNVLRRIFKIFSSLPKYEWFNKFLLLTKTCTENILGKFSTQSKKKTNNLPKLKTAKMEKEIDQYHF